MGVAETSETHEHILLGDEGEVGVVVAEASEAPEVGPAWRLKIGVILVVDETHEDVFPEDDAEELLGVNGLVSQGGFPEESE